MTQDAQSSPDIPDWVQDAVFYQVFPDRFARSDWAGLPARTGLHPWGAPPTPHGFQGGDLYGVIDRLDYLQDLGVTALYLNPIFASASNHRYHTYDYYQVDPLLGGNEALRALLAVAHERGLRVVLDGVFNHTGRGFFPFHHLMECGPESPYVGWFHVYDWPIRAYHDDPNYECWWALPGLPAFNTDNEEVRAYLWGVAEHWLRQGIDGWRLDVPEEIDDDDFWREFRRRCRAVNPDAYIVGELWQRNAHRWLSGDQFDAQMNYTFMKVALGFFAGERADQRLAARTGLLDIPLLDGPAFAAELIAMHGRYHPAIVHAQLNMLGSHDTARIRTLAGGDSATVSLLYLCQMTVAGAPNIYYGDEIGLQGGHEPESRQAFPWGDPASWDGDLRADIRRFAALRRALPCLRRGDFELLWADAATVAYRRAHAGRQAVVAFNSDKQPQPLVIPADLLDKPLPDALTPSASPLLPGLPYQLPGRGGRVWADSAPELEGDWPS